MSIKYQSMSAIAGPARVTLVDEEPVEFRIIAADVIRFEQNHKTSFFEGTPGLSRIGWVAWAAMKRLGLTELKPEEFLSKIADIETEDESADEDDVEDEGVDLPGPTEADTYA